MISVSEYQKDFIRFLLKEDALLFGSFKIKSGRQSPYFLNFGKLNSGEAIKRIGETYAQHIKQNVTELPSIVFGPAYKGVPLAVTTAASLYTLYNHSCNYCFDRKEVKTVGEGGMFVGKTPSAGESLVLVEDVVTAGTTLKKIVPMLKDELQVNLLGVCISVDRCEVGDGNLSAVQQMTQDLNINIYSVVTIHQIFSFLTSDEAGSHRLGEQVQQDIRQYLNTYGAKS